MMCMPEEEASMLVVTKKKDRNRNRTSLEEWKDWTMLCSISAMELMNGTPTFFLVSFLLSAIGQGKHIFHVYEVPMKRSGDKP